MTEAIGHGKGSLLIHTRDYVVRRGGEKAWSALVDAASAAERGVLSGIFLAGSWYPIGPITRVVARFCEATDAPDDEMRRLSAYIADTDLGSVYKMILRLGSPEMLVRRTGSLWGRYFDVGEMTPKQIDKQHWELRLAMALEDDCAPNRLFCGPGCPSWIEMGLRLTGATNARVTHVECRFKNRTACIYSVTW